jgi:uncharacterized protein (TIGR02246 family)
MADDPRQIGETILRQLEEAWNAADAPGFAAPFTDDADFVDIRGDHHRGRPAIEGGHHHVLSTIYRGSRVRYQLDGARRLTDDVYLAHNAATLDAPAGPMQGTHRATSTLVLVRTPEGWRIAAFQNTLATG